MRRSTPVLLWLVAACGSPGGSARPAPGVSKPAPVEGGAGERALESGWGRIRIVSRAIELRVPDSAAWRYRAGKTSASWVSLTHPARDEKLELWTARAPRLALAEDCEKRARLGRPELFVPTAETTVSREVLGMPSGYRSELTVGVHPEGADASVLVGEIVLFGAAPLRCLAVHYVTRVRGAGAGAMEEVARRLDVVARRVIPSIVVRSADARVPLPVQR